MVTLEHRSLESCRSTPGLDRPDRASRQVAAKEDNTNRQVHLPDRKRLEGAQSAPCLTRAMRARAKVRAKARLCGQSRAAESRLSRRGVENLLKVRRYTSTRFYSAEPL